MLDTYAKVNNSSKTTNNIELNAITGTKIASLKDSRCVIKLQVSYLTKEELI